MAFKDATLKRGEFFRYTAGASIEGTLGQTREISSREDTKLVREVVLTAALTQQNPKTGKDETFPIGETMLVDAKYFAKRILTLEEGSRIKLTVGSKHPVNGWGGTLLVDDAQGSLPLEKPDYRKRAANDKD